MRLLFATFEGGGHVPAPMLVAQALRRQGHEVLIVSDRCNAAAAAEKGLPFRPWDRAPDRGALGQADSGLDDWRTRWPPAVIRRLCDGVIAAPALAYALDVMEIAAAFRPDVIVSNELLFGVMMAAEKMAVPLALLTASVWCYPTRTDVPAFGPGFPLAVRASDRSRDQITRAVIHRLFDAGLTDLNAARRALALAPLTHALDQLMVADRVLLGASQAFDFGGPAAPDGFEYCGPLFETPGWAQGAAVLPDNGRPNVLISFSTTFQDQKPVMRRAMKALARLPVNGVVTLGPAVDRTDLPSADNIRILSHASHDVLVPQCAAVLCHGGHGTLLRPLSHGVPVVALPMGRDHPDNAARLAWLGAGLRLSEHASVAAIARAVRTVLDDPSYRAKAAAFAERLEDRRLSPARAAASLLAMGGQAARRAA